MLKRGLNHVVQSWRRFGLDSRAQWLLGITSEACPGSLPNRLLWTGCCDVGVISSVVLLVCEGHMSFKFLFPIHDSAVLYNLARRMFRYVAWSLLARSWNALINREIQSWRIPLHLISHFDSASRKCDQLWRSAASPSHLWHFVTRD
jgi:hypothetical protein